MKKPHAQNIKRRYSVNSIANTKRSLGWTNVKIPMKNGTEIDCIVLFENLLA